MSQVWPWVWGVLSSETTQMIAFWATVGALTVGYWRFHRTLFRFLVDCWMQAIILIVFFLLIYGQLGSGLGLPLLFWSENPLTRAGVSFAGTLLLAVIGLNGYYLMSPARLIPVMKKVLDFQGIPHTHVTSPGGTTLLARGPGPIDPSSYLSRIPGLIFLDHTPIDPSPPDVGIPFSNPYLLSRFLRVVRRPFLILLTLPALLPAYFEYLPRFAPIVLDTQKRVLMGEHVLGVLDLREPDVVDRFQPYLWALLVWLAGIWLAVMLVKLMILGASRLGGPRMNRKRSVAIYLGCVCLVMGLLAAPPLFGGEILGWHLSDNYYGGVPPGMAIMALLAGVAVLSAVGGLVFREGLCKPSWIKPHDWPRWKAPAIASLAAFIAWQNSDHFSNRFERLDYREQAIADLGGAIDANYPNDQRLPGTPAASAPSGIRPGPVPDLDALNAWKTAVGRPDGTRPKLVVVCTSGGAIRAGYWTAAVLSRLNGAVGRDGGEERFHKHVRIITGASGGMVGAAHYVANLSRDPGQGPRLSASGWQNEIPIFSLAPVARTMALRDPYAALIRRPLNLLGFYPDRGRVLEEDWPALRFAFSNLRGAEGEGQLPSLIFSPMTIEDGRRLLITNLDLSTHYREVGRGEPPPPSPLPSIRRLAVNAANLIPSTALDADGRPTSDGIERVSVSSIEFYKVFNPTPETDIFLSTAARMSATFPFVSPAVCLPSNPPLRVVDAGYYDNYGVDVAAAWIFANRLWIEKNTSGVAVVQIRDGLSAADRIRYPIAGEDLWARLFRGTQFFTSPIDGIARARVSSSSFRNDALIAGLSDYFSERSGHRDYFTTAIFELASRTVMPLRGPVWEWPGDDLNRKLNFADDSQATEVAMSWYLTVAERQAIDMAIPTETDGDFRRIGKRRPVGWGTLLNDRDMGGGPDGDAPTLVDLLGPDATEIRAIDVNDPGARSQRIRDLMDLAAKVRKRLDEARKAFSGDPSKWERYLSVIDKEIARARNYEGMFELDRWWRKPVP